MPEEVQPAIVACTMVLLKQAQVGESGLTKHVVLLRALVRPTPNSITPYPVRHRLPSHPSATRPIDPTSHSPHPLAARRRHPAKAPHRLTHHIACLPACLCPPPPQVVNIDAIRGMLARQGGAAVKALAEGASDAALHQAVLASGEVRRRPPPACRDAWAARCRPCLPAACACLGASSPLWAGA